MKVEIPVVGQGTWQIPESGSARKTAIEAMIKGTELGMVHIDTAEMYGNAEEVVGEVLEKVDREKLFVVSKVLPSNASYTSTISALEKTLKRLNTDYLDCYLLHWRGSIPLSDTMAAFEKLEKDGKVKSFGVSNFDVEDLEEAIECLTTGKLACNQVLYNMNVRGIERNLIPFCQKHSISIVGYTPYGHIPSSNSPEGKSLSDIAKKHNASERQVILRFLTRLDNTFTIPKASNPKHVLENAGATDFDLDDEDLSKLNEAFPAPDRDTPLAML